MHLVLSRGVSLHYEHGERDKGGIIMRLPIWAWILYYGWPIVLGGLIIWFIYWVSDVLSLEIVKRQHIHTKWWVVITLLILAGVICLYVFVVSTYTTFPF